MYCNQNAFCVDPKPQAANSVYCKVKLDALAVSRGPSTLRPLRSAEAVYRVPGTTLPGQFSPHHCMHACCISSCQLSHLTHNDLNRAAPTPSTKHNATQADRRGV
jgi:hypothetical protein